MLHIRHIRHNAGRIGIAALLAALGMLLAAFPALAGNNLIVNPDWENGTSGWVIQADNATLSQNGETLIYSSVYQDVLLAENAGGQELTLSAMLKAEPSQLNIDMGMIICKSDGSHISGFSESETNTEWAYHEITAAVPSEAAYARIYLTIWKNGEASSFGFDEMSLTMAQISPGIQKGGSFAKADAHDRTADGTAEADAQRGYVKPDFPDPTDAPAEVYTFTDYNGVEYAAPVALFATRVVECVPGSPWAYYEEDMNPENALGLPDYDEPSNTGEYCLGAGGMLVLEFDMALYDGPGADIFVFELGSAAEDMSVEVSDDLAVWYELGTASWTHGALDMSGIVPDRSAFRYIRLTDVSLTGGNWPGGDIDAVCGFYGRPIERGSADKPAQPANPDAEYLNALVETGKAYYSGTSQYGYDREKARECFAEAAEADNGEAWNYLGNLMMNSIEPDRYALAMECYKKAEEYGFEAGLVGQGMLYESGLGVGRDYGAAYELYARAADDGYAEGYCGLAGLYQYGNGVYQDETVAMEYYKMALESRDFIWRNHARRQIARMYKDDIPGIGRDYSMTYDWYMMAVSEGYGPAFFGIADMYYSGLGVERDYSEAFEWFKLAAAHGDPSGMYYAGYMLEIGRGVARNYGQALQYYEQSASLGRAEAMFRAGRILANVDGEFGTIGDPQKAGYWLKLALSFTDDAELVSSINELLPYVAPEEIG